MENMKEETVISGITLILPSTEEETHYCEFCGKYVTNNKPHLCEFKKKVGN